MLKAFYQDWYAPNNAMLVVAGDVQSGRHARHDQELYGKIPRRDVRAAARRSSLSPVKPETFTLDSNLPYVLALVSYRLPGTDSADFAAAHVLADVLASQRGDLYALVPAGKALEAQFELAETYPKASVGIATGALRAGRHRSVGHRREHAPDPVGLRANGLPADLVDAAKRREIASAEFRRNSIPRPRRRLVASARRRRTHTRRTKTSTPFAASPSPT